MHTPPQFKSFFAWTKSLGSSPSTTAGAISSPSERYPYAYAACPGDTIRHRARSGPQDKPCDGGTAPWRNLSVRGYTHR